MNDVADVLVIGGGPAGAVLGAHLAQTGRSVQLVEKSAAAHHKMCGEFLSYEAVRYLQSLGLDLQALGAVELTRVRLSRQDVIAEAALPFTAMSLTRRTLDEALLGHARERGVNIRRGQRVASLVSTRSRWSARLDHGEELSGANAFLATGKHDLSDHLRPSGKQADLVAFKMYFRLAPRQHIASASTVEIFLFEGGYAGLQPIEDGMANLCLLIKKSILRRCGSGWQNLLQHLRDSSRRLAHLLDEATALLPKPLALASIPYGYVRSGSSDGLWRLGDQAAVIPSFSGDGMSIALHSAHVAAAEFLQGHTADVFQHRIRNEVRRSVALATTLSRVMIAVPALAEGVRFWPDLLQWIVGKTRIPEHALLAQSSSDPKLHMAPAIE